MTPDPTDATGDHPAPVQPQRCRYRLVVAYDGTLFHGWQKQQPPGLEPLRTVQGVVEAAVAEALQQPITLVGASRTDAGVHAQGQVAQFDAATRIPIQRLAAAINSRLPEDVEVLAAARAADDFEAINQARSKQYRYRIFHATQRPLQQRNYVYHCWHNLDVARMNAAAGRLVGQHDFAAFTAAGHDRETTVRTIHLCAVEDHAAHGFEFAATPVHEVHIIVQGNGFLYNMVRIIAGTLLDVGRGAMAPGEIDGVIASCDRRQAGPTLPPQGLCLEWIRYDDAAQPVP